MRQQSLKILVVDDETSIRLSLEIALKMANHTVRGVESGELAIELMEREPFDLVILDNRMAGMSGMDVMRWIQEHRLNMPTIMLTAVGSEDLAVEAMRLGAYDYIRKDQLEFNHLPIIVQGVYERFLYRREISRRMEEKQQEQEKEKELAALRNFQQTVQSIGQFVETGLLNLSRTLGKHENDMRKIVNADSQDRCGEIFGAIKQEIEIVSSGIKSMVELSALVTKRLEGLHTTELRETS